MTKNIEPTAKKLFVLQTPEDPEESPIIHPNKTAKTTCNKVEETNNSCLRTNARTER